MKIIMSAIALLLAGLPAQPQPPLNPSDKKVTDALAIAKKYAERYYKVPDCRGGNSKWHYSVWEVDDKLVAEVGPTRARGHGVKVTMRMSNLKVIRVEHLA
ncbi:MAG: hypothetical protein ABIO86_08225 [Sphingomonas sp.]